MMGEYEKYRLNWMIEHGHTLPELIRQLSRLRDECDDVGLTVEEVWEMWEDEYGFAGELWVCYKEWAQAEGKDIPIEKH